MDSMAKISILCGIYREAMLFLSAGLVIVFNILRKVAETTFTFV